MEEKTKLIKLTSSAWHYKLIKFMFGSMLPDPKQLKNLCPYFWLLIASLLLIPIVMPFYLIFVIIKWCAEKFGNFIEKFGDKCVEKWLNTITPVEAWDLWECDDQILDRPRFIKKISNWTLLVKWAEKQGISVNENGFNSKLTEFFTKYKEERQKKIAQIEKERYDQEMLRSDNYWKRKKQAEESREKLDKVFISIFKPFNKIGESLSKINFSQVIKITKNIIGVILTAFFVVVLYFVVQLFTFLTLWIISIWNGAAVIFGLLFVLKWIGFALAIAIAAILIYKLSAYITIQKRKNKIPKWFIPIMYLGIGIYKVFEYIVWYPTYFIFVSFLYKFIIIQILWGILKGLGKGLVKFTGIFGDYFSATKGDYCPGIEWDNETPIEEEV